MIMYCNISMCTLYPPCWPELLYPLQDGYTPLHFTAWGGRTTCVERLLSTPGIDVNIKGRVSPLYVIKDNTYGEDKRDCEFMFENSAIMYKSD